MSQPRIDWQWPAVIAYCATAASMTFLIHTGKLHPEVLIGLVTWLAPSPYRGKPDDKQLPPTPAP